MSKSDEFAHLAEEAEQKANRATDAAAKRLWEAVATEWHEAENSARREERGRASSAEPRGGGTSRGGAVRPTCGSRRRGWNHPVNGAHHRVA
jgi:hypothetical protein